MSGGADPLDMVRQFFPSPEECYYVGLALLCIIFPMVVSMFYVISDVKNVIGNNPAYDAAAFRFFVNNTYYIVLITMLACLINLLYALRKGPEKADSSNMGFWFIFITFPLFFLIGARISLLISTLVVSSKDDIIINLNPADVVYIRTKLSYLTIPIFVSFLFSILAFLFLYGIELLDLASEFI